MLREMQLKVGGRGSKNPKMLQASYVHAPLGPLRLSRSLHNAAYHLRRDKFHAFSVDVKAASAARDCDYGVFRKKCYNSAIGVSSKQSPLAVDARDLD